ncbi:flagellin N-terminal helical domain-containing protein [Tepidibacter mesophilus]|uniref:flagellin N-terminal helical domain-containing protein n=1 Tax=Tepidibacter mesophilus TaxID=655607 RepID=UPI001FA85CD2|nr:flagellin [Tepidibacter mesophilus]
MVGFSCVGMRMINHMNYLNSRNSVLMERLCTGKRINRAADDPAGLAISEKMKAQIRGLSMAQRNVQDGISMIQTAEGAMNEIHNILQRMNELAVQASNATYTDGDRQNLDLEFQQLKDTITEISEGTEFNNKKLIDGSQKSDGITLQVGPNSGNYLKVKMGDLSELGLHIDGINISNQQNAQDAIEKVKTAVSSVSRERSYLGAMQNRLEHTLNNLGTYEENLTAACSRITDADMAKTMMEYTKNQILMQVSQAMLAQHIKMERERMLGLLKSLGV